MEVIPPKHLRGLSREVSRQVSREVSRDFFVPSRDQLSRAQKYPSKDPYPRGLIEERRNIPISSRYVVMYLLHTYLPPCCM